MVFGGGGRSLDVQNKSLESLFSLSEKSEQELPASERENGWRVAYGSSQVVTHCRPLQPFLCFVNNKKTILGLLYKHSVVH